MIPSSINGRHKFFLKSFKNAVRALKSFLLTITDKWILFEKNILCRYKRFLMFTMETSVTIV